MGSARPLRVGDGTSNTSLKDVLSTSTPLQCNVLKGKLFIRRHFYLLCALGTLNASVRRRWYRRMKGKPCVCLGKGRRLRYVSGFFSQGYEGDAGWHGKILWGFVSVDNVDGLGYI